MTDRRRPTRRQLLGGAIGAGALGFLSGAGSGALLSDGEWFEGSFATDHLDLEVAAASGDAAVTDFEDGSVTLPFEDLQPGASGRASIGIRSCGAPATVRVTLETTPDSSSALLAAIDATLSVVSPEGPERRLFDGPAVALPSQFGDGHRLAECVRCEPSVVALDWTLREQVGEAVSGGTAALRATFTGRRCGDEATSTRGNR